GTLTFHAGDTTQTFTVATTPDALFELDETFTAQISNATGGATITTGGSALGTIVNDEATPAFSVTAANAIEGGAVVFTVTRNVDSQATQTIHFNTTVGGGNPAVSGGDFTAASGTLTFATGTMSQTFTVASLQDTVFEGDETFAVELSNALPAGQTSIATATALGTIVNDEATPAFSVSASSVTEGGAITFTVTRSVNAQALQTVDFHTTLATGNSASVGDFTAAASTTLSFTQGVNSQTFVVATTPDLVF